MAILQTISFTCPQHLHITVIFEYIKERNPVNGVNARKPFLRTGIYKYIKEHILARNPTNVINVIKSFHNIVIYD